MIQAIQGALAQSGSVGAWLRSVLEHGQVAATPDWSKLEHGTQWAWLFLGLAVNPSLAATLRGPRYREPDWAAWAEAEGVPLPDAERVPCTDLLVLWLESKGVDKAEAAALVSSVVTSAKAAREA